MFWQTSLLATAASVDQAFMHGPDCDVDAIWRSLHQLESLYPGFRTWFWGRTAPGIANGQRKAFVRADGNGILGIVIAKRALTERKLCTVWVAPHARHLGLASSLIDEAVDWLDTSRPLLTVPEERIDEFKAIVAARRFDMTCVLESYYRAGRKEYVFNGLLRSESTV